MMPEDQEEDINIEEVPQDIHSSVYIQQQAELARKKKLGARYGQQSEQSKAIEIPDEDGFESEEDAVPSDTVFAQQEIASKKTNKRVNNVRF